MYMCLVKLDGAGTRKKIVTENLDPHLKQACGKIRLGGSPPISYLRRDGCKEAAIHGPQGSFATHPSEVDCILQCDWKKIYKGVSHNLAYTISQFFSKYSAHIFYGDEFQVDPIATAGMSVTRPVE